MTHVISPLASPVPVEQAYTALREGALLVDLSQGSRGVFHGPKAASVLNGLVTNEVASLAPGEGVYAAALTPKGKVLADVRILRRDDDLLVDVSAAAAAGWWAMIRKYVNPRLSRFEDVSSSLGALGLFGPGAAMALGAAAGQGAPELAVHAHAPLLLAGVITTVARVSDAGVPGFVLYAPSEAMVVVAQGLVAAGAVPGGLDALEIARVEAGRPAWGVDMDETTLTQEVRLDELDAVSYSKGCYTGQETVARLHFRGHVNRLLRGLLFPGGAPVPRGAALQRPDATAAGEVRSTVRSPRLGAIGLGLVRREVEPGTTLTARWNDGRDEAQATVVALPFDE